MGSLNGFTAELNTQPQPWGLLLAQLCGWNLNSAGDPLSSSRFPLEGNPGVLRDTRKPWILLVEDNPGDVVLVREALDEYQVQCEITVVTDGERAFQLIDEMDQQRRPCPDLMLLDLNLPRRDGREILERMRASTQCRHIPVVILTSSDAPEDREITRRLGASRYLRKPSHLDEFMELGGIFKQMLGNSSGSSLA